MAIRLKQLELYGYKSFATRCSFAFGEGITAIVGPNGSGKSNVADALRWVTGEQRFSHLRAKTTEDLIFSGTRHRARLGMAEVLVTLDNTSGWLPIDYAEVSIGRRAYRSGDNEYLINGETVRYRDVLDLLSAGGVARNSYTVIGQGMVDAALSLRPGERRELFEEAAGITPHLRRRDQSLRRIQETERNLERISDILAEMSPRAQRLRRQAERADEHALLTRDLEELQRIYYGYQWQRLNRDLARATEAVEARQAHLSTHSARARGFRHRQTALVDEQAHLRSKMARLRRDVDARRHRCEELRRQVAILHERDEMLSAQRTAIGDELQALSSRCEILQQEVTRAEEELAQHRDALCAASEALEAAREKLSAIAAARQSVQDALNNAQRSARSLQREMASCDGTIEELERRDARQKGDAAAAAERLAKLEHEVAELDERVQRASSQVSDHASAVVDRERVVDEARQRAADARDELSQAQRHLMDAESRRDRLLSRRNALERLREEHAGYFPGVRAVLAAESRLGGILGTVASLIRVPGELETAIEAALGSRLQNVVTDSWAAAERAVAMLKERHAGWATFLPLDALRPQPTLTIDATEDVLGVASDLVRYAPELEPAVHVLLGRTVIVRTLAAARRILDSRVRASLIVTIEGETIQPSGALSGGSRARQQPLLSQEREWRELPRRIAAAEDDLQEAQDACARLSQELSEISDRIGRGEKALDTERTTLAREREALQAVSQSLADRQRDMDWQREHRQSLELETKEVQRVLSHSLVKRESIATQLDRANQQVGDSEARLATVDDREARQTVSDLETRRAVAQRTVSSQERLVDSHRSNLHEARQQITDKEQQRTRVEEALATTVLQLHEVEGERAAALAALEEAEAQLGPADEALNAIEERSADLERERGVVQEHLQEAEAALHDAILERDRLADRQTSLAQEIESQLGPISLPETQAQQLRLDLGGQVVELPRVTALPPGLGDQVRQLRARIRRIGHVNPDAPQEYAELTERQTFLDGQADDLRSAIASIRHVISELDEAIAHDFSETVRRVDAAFREYFGHLFGGGHARLTLTDPNDAVSTGVDIEAHPPGKRSTALSLLSGGERSLTAVALIFALLDANPVPFCILDEVDAALDESNVGRFRALLENHARETQFVVITHNRNTIEAASALYGVSMGEQGVSQTVSLELSAPQ